MMTSSDFADALINPPQQCSECERLKAEIKRLKADHAEDLRAAREEMREALVEASWNHREM